MGTYYGLTLKAKIKNIPSVKNVLYMLSCSNFLTGSTDGDFFEFDEKTRILCISASTKRYENIIRLILFLNNKIEKLIDGGSSDCCSKEDFGEYSLPYCSMGVDQHFIFSFEKGILKDEFNAYLIDRTALELNINNKEIKNERN
jgi:hypothetical protein